MKKEKKQIKIKKETWRQLSNLKTKHELKSIDMTINYLLDKEKENVK